MKLQLIHDGMTQDIGYGYTFDSAMEWAENHGEANDWSPDYNYTLVDDNGKVYVIEMGAWFEVENGNG